MLWSANESSDMPAEASHLLESIRAVHVSEKSEEARQLQLERTRCKEAA
jgi:hypothetical protein